MRPASLLASLLTTSFIAVGQVSYFRGELRCSNCGGLGNYIVELTDYSRRQVASAYVSRSGEFMFQTVPEGSYLLYVKTMHGEQVHMQSLMVSSSAMSPVVQLPERNIKSSPTPTGVVSVKQLQHKVPKEARKHFNRSLEETKRGDNDGAIRELQKAVEIDPEYLNAWNNLGARYLRSGNLKAALQAFDTAIQLDPTSAMVQSNAAMALLMAGNATAAELAARRALESNPAHLQARFMLGLSLHAQKEYSEEAMDQLRRVQHLYPTARLALAEMAIANGATKEARTQLKTYLDTSNEQDQNRKAAESMLVALR